MKRNSLRQKWLKSARLTSSSTMKLDILAFAAHPDDVELSCAGTLHKAVKQGKKVGVVDFTQGELGTRGTPETRRSEAEDSAKILGLSVRENLSFEDGFFRNDKDHQLEVIRMLRRYRPDVVLANAIDDRHSDHGRAAQLAKEACFLAGLAKIETMDDGASQKPWRPKAVYHYIQSIPIEPDFIVDVSDEWEVKMNSVRAFKTQFFDPKSDEPETYISNPRFMEMINSRGIHYGHEIGVQYGEGFTVERKLGVRDITDLL